MINPLHLGSAMWQNNGTILGIGRAELNSIIKWEREKKKEKTKFPYMK